MVATPVRVGFLVERRRSDRQEAAREWADGRYDVEVLDPERVTASTPHDVLRWHREEPPRVDVPTS